MKFIKRFFHPKEIPIPAYVREYQARTGKRIVFFRRIDK